MFLTKISYNENFPIYGSCGAIYVSGIMLDTCKAINPWLRVSLQKTVLHAKMYTQTAERLS